MAASTLLLVDNDALLAAWLKQELGQPPFSHEVIHISKGSDAIAYCRQTPAQIALLEWLLTDMDSRSIAVELSKLARPPKVIAFTALSDESTLYFMSRAAIHGIVWKTSSAVVELRTAIPEVLSGRSYISPGVRAAIAHLRGRPDAFFKILSERELGLLPLFARGLSDNCIALRAGISVATARSHRQHIMGKLGVHSTPALMRWAAEKGFIHDRCPPCLCWNGG